MILPYFQQRLMGMFEATDPNIDTCSFDFFKHNTIVEERYLCMYLATELVFLIFN